MSDIYLSNINLMGKVMDLRLERQNVVMSNIANLDVSGYKAHRLHFEKELQAALGDDAHGRMTVTEGNHLGGATDPANVQGSMAMEWKPRVVAGLDSVSMETEMSIMAKNTLMYNALTEVTKKSFEGLQKVITDGGK